jgi:hypothetical protein
MNRIEIGQKNIEPALDNRPEQKPKKGKNRYGVLRKTSITGNS